MNGVNTPDAQSVRPPDVTPSRITYETGVFDPEVAPANAAYVTTPVVRFNVYVPWPDTATLVNVHVATPDGNDVPTGHKPVPDEESVVIRAGPPDVPKPPAAVTDVNATDAPGPTDFVSLPAVGDGGEVTVGVMVEHAR
jgi:hypothetical protein